MFLKVLYMFWQVFAPLVQVTLSFVYLLFYCTCFLLNTLGIKVVLLDSAVFLIEVSNLDDQYGVTLISELDIRQIYNNNIHYYVYSMYILIHTIYIINNDIHNYKAHLDNNIPIYAATYSSNWSPTRW